MAIERIVDTSAHDDDGAEQQIEVTLRPQTFDEYVGQERLKRNLRLAIEAAVSRLIMCYCMDRQVSARRQWRVSLRMKWELGCA